MGIGIGKIITGAIMIALSLSVLFTPLTSVMSMVPAGLLPPEAMGIVTAMLTGKTISDVPQICATALTMAAGYGTVPTELANACALANKYIPLLIYSVYGTVAIGALMITWGLSSLFSGKKEKQPKKEKLVDQELEM